jgi:hypothetical protein
VLQPVGSRPPQIYWARRLVLLLIAAVLVVVAAHACGGVGSSGADPRLRQRADQTPVVSPTRTPTPSPSTTAGHAGAICRPRDLAVTVTADAATYPLGVNARFTAVVRNNGPACRFPTALSTRTWRILSGTDEVWSTADCPRSAEGKRVRLAAHAQITYVLPWDRFRSTPGCAVAGAPAQAGTYRLYVTIAGALGHPVVFHLAD